MHLDEETRFDAETVRGVLQHCVQEDEAITRGEKVRGVRACVRACLRGRRRRERCYYDACGIDW